MLRFGDIKQERMVGQMFWVPVSRHTGYWQVRVGTAASRIVDATAFAVASQNWIVDMPGGRCKWRTSLSTTKGRVCAQTAASSHTGKNLGSSGRPLRIVVYVVLIDTVATISPVSQARWQWTPAPRCWQDLAT